MPYPCSICYYYDYYHAECMKDEPCKYDDMLSQDATARDVS